MTLFDDLHISFVHSLEDVHPDEWNACNAADNPFVSHAFLAALEASGSVGGETGWLPYHMLLRSGATDTAELLGCMPLYLKSHSYGEYVFDHGWADAYVRAGGQYYPKLQSCAPFTPATGPRIMVNARVMEDMQAELRRALLQGLRQITEKLGVSSAHLTFLPEAEANTAADNGFLIRHDQQFHWHNDGYVSFDDFLSRLSSRKRKQIRKERRTVDETDIRIETLTGDMITEEHWDAFFAFYMDTGSRKWGTPYLTRAFFSEIGNTIADKIVLFMCSRDNRYIAGALNFVGPGTLYGRQWGCIEDHPCLHFETCYYKAIDFAIKHKLACVEAGAQGAHKLARGYAPVRTYSAHYIENAGFRDAVARFLEHERRGVADDLTYLDSKTPFKKTS